MYTAQKAKLINYLTTGERTETWRELGQKFGLSLHTARNTWNSYLENKPKAAAKAVEINDKAEAANYVAELENKLVSKFTQDIKTGNAQVETTHSEQIKSLEQLIEVCEIDTTKWQIEKYICNSWNSKWQVKAYLSPLSSAQAFHNNFSDFLKTYKGPKLNVDYKGNARLTPGCLVINKQDSHLNKYDINGENDIFKRFRTIEGKMESIALRASAGRTLECITYIIGSDEFNSEWTGMTTKGTPQANILDYHKSFKLICDHEIDTIAMLLKYTKKVNVMFLCGNHDHYVGWHMAMFLEAFFRSETKVDIDSSSDYRKYAKYYNTGMMFNHGDQLKGEQLAGIFPMEFKGDWSSCKHYYIFTGDKHNTLTKDINGIQFYQLPAISKAKSKWDEQRGYGNTKSELTGFMITREDGMSDIYKEYIE